MIGFLNGTVVIKEDPHLIIDVGGVGYKVAVPKGTLSKAGLDGKKLKLFIYTHVRDDALELFGFENPQDLKLFRYLIGVSGIGPKTAMNIFSIGDRSQITSAIISADTAFFKSVPRLGQKNAQKIIIELKNKLGSTVELDLNGADMSENQDVINALKTFGFTNKEISEAIKAVQKNGQNATETIRLALKYLGK